MLMLMVGIIAFLCIKSIGQHSSVTGYLIFLAVNVALLVGVFTVRAVWNKAVTLTFTENRVFPALNNLLDPDLFLLLWTFTIYLFWGSRELQVFDENGRNTGKIRFAFVPGAWPLQSMPDTFTRYRRLLSIVLVFWAIRNVLVEIFMYKILLGFLTNFRSSVLKYLQAYALLRKLNAGWIKLVPTQSNPQGSGTTPINLDQLGSPPCAEKRPQKKLKKADRMYHIQYTGRILPTVLSKKNIEAVQKSAFVNLLSITWIRANPTVLFVDGQRCELRSKRVAKAVARLLFGQLRNFRNELLNMEREAILASPVTPMGIRLDQTTLKRLQTATAIKLQRSKNAIGEADTPREPSPVGAAQEPGKPGYKICITGETEKPLADRLAEKLGCRNEDDDSDTTDDEVEDDRARVVRNDMVPKRRFNRFINDDLLDKKDADPLVKVLLKKREQGRSAAQVGSTPQEQQTFSDPAIDTLRMRRQPSAAVGTRDRGPRHRTIGAFLPGSKDMLDPGPLAALRRDFSGGPPQAPSPEARRSGDALPRLSASGSMRVFRPPDAQHASAPFERDKEVGNQKWEGQALPRSTSVMNSEESESMDVFAVETEAPIMMDAAATPQSATQTNTLPANTTQPDKQGDREGGGKLEKGNDSKKWERIAEREMLNVKVVEPDDRDCLDREFFSLFVSGRELDSLLDTLDPGRIGKVTEKMFVRGVLEVHHRRKQMCASLDAQREIEGVFHRVATYVLTFILFLAFLIVLGVGTNTIVVSGAAALSASGVILSFLYTDFILSIILIVFLNPYSIGDEVEINGSYMKVQKITTYFTEFALGTGRIVYLAHKEIARMGLINQSRGVNVAWGLTLRVTPKITWNQYQTFKRVLEAFLAAHPLEYRPNLFISWSDVQPNRWVDIMMWVTCADVWASPSHWPAKAQWYNYVIKTADSLELGYPGDMTKVDLALKEGNIGSHNASNVSTVKTPFGPTPMVDMTQPR